MQGQGQCGAGLGGAPRGAGLRGDGAQARRPQERRRAGTQGHDAASGVPEENLASTARIEGRRCRGTRCPRVRVCMTVDGGGSMRVRGQRWRFYRDARGPRHRPWAGGGGETGLRDSCWAERANDSGSGSGFF